MDKQKLQDFNQDPFGFVDKLNLTFRGYNFNFFQKYLFIQKASLGIIAVCSVLWIIQGFDSNPLQLIIPWFEKAPGMLLSGHFSWAEMIGSYNYYYGKEMHYSAFVIYVGLYYLLSKSWQRAGVKGCKNMIFSFAPVFLAIGVFEWFWILSFGTFQNQPWVYTWRMPQLRILAQNLVFTLAGGLTTLYMLIERWHWDGKIQGERSYYFQAKSWKLWLCAGLSVGSALFWIFYPGYIQPLSVPLANGTIWHSSKLFPQTLYTIDINPGGAINAGEWFWIHNDLIHLTNTAVKAIWAFTAYLLFRVKVHG